MSVARWLLVDAGESGLDNAQLVAGPSVLAASLTQQQHLQGLSSSSFIAKHQHSTSLAPTSGGSGGHELADRRQVPVRFSLKFKVEWGQAVRLIGSHPKLGGSGA